MFLKKYKKYSKAMSDYTIKAVGDGYNHLLNQVAPKE